jgi:dTDP-4-dehydrorhamnose reductase
MRVLLLGANGMLGSDTRTRWADTELTALDYPAVDLADRTSVGRVVAAAKPDLILNCTGYTAVDDAESHEAEADALNGTGVGFLAEAAREAGAQLVHYSTDYVFDGAKSDGYGEGDAPRPLSAYGRTKLRGETLLKASGARYYLVRTSWLYGRHGKNFVDTMLKLADSGKPLRVVNDQIGKPTYTVDLALATRSLVLDRAPGGTYHLVNENATSWYDFAVEIFRQADRSVTVEPVPTSSVPRPAPRPAHSALRNTKRPPLRPWRAALADYLAIRK